MSLNKSKLKIAVISNMNSYPGKEYAKALSDAGIEFDLILIGDYQLKNKLEDERCGNLWNPPAYDKEKLNIYHFESLKTPQLIEFLNIQNYDLGIQGGTGILKNEVIEKFKLGILNFHPGDLPYYRGCMAPEWQLYEDKPIISTCHIVDKGIDTGDIHKKKNLDLTNKGYSYAEIRSKIYTETSKFVVEILKEISLTKKIETCKQNHAEAIYRKVMPEDIYKNLIYKINTGKNLANTGFTGGGGQLLLLRNCDLVLTKNNIKNLFKNAA